MNTPCIAEMITAFAEGMTEFGTRFSRRRNLRLSTRRRKCLIPATQARSADIFVENWIGGGKVAFEVSVVSPTRLARMLRAAQSPSAAVEKRKSSVRDHFERVKLSCTSVQLYYTWSCLYTKLVLHRSRLG